MSPVFEPRLDIDQEVLLYAGLMIEIAGDQIRAEERERCARVADQYQQPEIARRIRNLPV